MSVLLGDGIGAIGETKHSMLSTAQFQALYGPGWVLADGSSYPSSQYAVITSNTSVPDLRATFLRAKDNGRGLNPDGDLALGTFESDTFASHNHPGSTGTNGAHTHTPGGAATFLCTGGNSNAHLAVTGNSHDSQPTTSSAGDHSHGVTTNNVGSAETRPKYVTVNIFIRIN